MAFSSIHTHRVGGLIPLPSPVSSPCGCWAGSSLEVTGSTPGCGIWGDVPMMDRFLPRHGSIRRASRFYPAVTPATFSCGGSMVSGRRPVCAAAGA
ncbi:hypothetical protein Hanom_Chr03g00259991 [Helianthus anomalus]